MANDGPNNPDRPVTNTDLNKALAATEGGLKQVIAANKTDFENALAATKGEFKELFSAHKSEMEQLLADQANVILEAVDEKLDKKLDEKFDPVITKLDGIMKGVEALQQENIVGAEQLRRHDDQLNNHERRIKAIELQPQH